MQTAGLLKSKAAFGCGCIKSTSRETDRTQLLPLVTASVTVYGPKPLKRCAGGFLAVELFSKPLAGSPKFQVYVSAFVVPSAMVEFSTKETAAFGRHTLVCTKEKAGCGLGLINTCLVVEVLRQPAELVLYMVTV